jgi:hypothetical protein
MRRQRNAEVRPRSRPRLLTGNTPRPNGEEPPVTATFGRFPIPPFALGSDRKRPSLNLRQDTPPDALARDPIAGGRSTGSRVTVFGRLPRNEFVPSGKIGRRLSAYSCGGSRGIVCTNRCTRTAFPFDPFREPPLTILAASLRPVKRGAQRASGDAHEILHQTGRNARSR